MEILDVSEVDNEDAEKLAYYIRTTVLSKLVFPYLEFSAFGALQVARALRAVPNLKADKPLCFLEKQTDFSHVVELINDYSDLLNKGMESDGGTVCFSFLLPDSTTSETTFYVDDDIDIDDVVVEHLAEAVRNNSSVQALRLCCQSSFSDVGAKVLVEAINCNTIFEELELSYNNAGSIVIESFTTAIGSNTALKKLVLQYNDIGGAGAEALTEVLSCNTFLEELDLTYNKIGSGGSEALAQAIRSNTALKKLVLNSNGIGGAGAEALAKVLSCNTFLEELDLTYNKIGSGGSEALAQAIRSNTALKKLVLGYNGIGDTGAEALAKGLSCNTFLEELDLTHNEIGNGGAEALAQAIRSNTALKKLDVGSGVSDVGAIALAQALHSNSSLEVLDLQWNCIGDSGAEAFAEELHHNSTITHLDLSGNKDIGEEGVHHLIQALTVNDSISENGLRLDRKGSKCALNCSGYRNVEHKIKWW